MSGVIASARSFLFVPGNRPERLPKALACGAHAVIVDLEDAVAPEGKALARRAFADALQSAGADADRVLVRINAAGTPWHEDDLALLMHIASRRLAGVVLPKAEDRHAIERVARMAARPVVPLVESAAGLHAIDAVAAAHGVARIAFGNLDFQLDVGLQCSDDEHEVDSVRLAIAMASRRANLPAPIDGVTVALDDDARLKQDTLRAQRLGFRAKLCIHPRQVATVNDTFAPSAAQLAWAQRVIAAAQGAGSGAFKLDGQMVDEPVLLRARSLLEAA
jgi:citrate lyase subunit beta/citryl-CoA lyase